MVFYLDFGHFFIFYFSLVPLLGVFPLLIYLFISLHHFWVWSFIWTLVLSFFSSIVPTWGGGGVFHLFIYKLTPLLGVVFYLDFGPFIFFFNCSLVGECFSFIYL